MSITPKQRKYIADRLLPLLRRAWPDWTTSLRRGGWYFVSSDHAWRLYISSAHRYWQIFKEGSEVASGPSPDNPHQAYAGRGWLRVFCDDILAAWHELRRGS